MDDSIVAKKRLLLLERRKKHPLKSNDKDIIDLLTQCQHADVTSVKTSKAVLLFAAQKNWLDLISFIPDLQLAISTASHPHILIYLLCNLLRLPNSIQSSLLKAHPLVAITINNPTLIPHCITGSIQLLKQHLDIHTFNVTKPFFKYILLQPSNDNNMKTTQHLIVADTLHTQLLQLVNEVYLSLSQLSTYILDMLLSTCSFYQCTSIDCLLSTVCRINSLCRTIVSLCVEKSTTLYSDQLIHFCLSLCMECTKQGVPIDELLSNLKVLLFRFDSPTVSSCLCLSWLLLNHLIDSHTTKTLLEIIQEIFSNGGTHTCLLRLFRLPLIAIISQNSPLLTKSIKSTANQLLSTLEQSSDLALPYKDVGSSLNITSCLSSYYTSLCVISSQYIHQYIKEGKLNWLEFEVISSHYQTDIISLGNITCAIEPAKTCQLIIPHLLKKNKNSNMGSTLLSYIMYSLAHINDREEEHETRLNLLLCFPSLCSSSSSSVTTELVTKTLLTFAKQLDLRPTALRLLTKVWEINDKIFPSLRSLLLPPVTGPCRVEWSIASAACLRDICALRPEVHGEECLSYISQLLSYCQHSLMISLLISALNNLCLSGIIESPGSLWKLLGPQLAIHNNPGIDKALCEFFSLGSEFSSNEEERPDNKLFHEEALKYLWKLTLKPNWTTVQNALKTLVSFSIDSHTFNVLPDQLVTLLKEDQQIDEEKQTNLPLNYSQLYLLFLSLTKPYEHTSSNSSCLNELVTYLVNEEIESLPRGLVFNALKKLPSIDKNFEKLQTELNQFLNTLEYSHNERTPAIHYLLNGLRHFDDDSLPTKQKEQLLISLKKTLEFGIHDDDLWTFNEGLLWCEFMNRLLEIEIKCCTSKPSQAQKREEILTKAINKIFATLKGLVRHSLAGSIGALVGVVCATLETTPKFMISLLECLRHLLITGVLPRQPGNIYETLQMLVSMTTLNNMIKNILLFIPTLTYQLSNYTWVAFEIKSELTELTSALISVIEKDGQNTTLVYLASFGLSSFISDLPFIDKELKCSCLTMPPSQIDTLLNHLPLLMTHIEKTSPRFDTIDVLLRYIQSDSISVKDIHVISFNIATWLPYLVCNGQVPFDEGMKCVQVLAELATTHHKRVPELHLFLGIIVHDLYTSGAGLSLRGLMESLAVRWIQEGLSSVNDISDTNQVLSPMYGIAGLLGLSTLNYKFLTDYDNDNFLQSLLSSSLSFICQCCSLSDESIKNTALQIISLTYHKYILKKINKEDLFPSDYSYLLEGNCLSVIYNQLHQYCTQSNGVLVSDTQVFSIIEGLSCIKIHLPPVKWDHILLSMMCKNDHCQESVIKFVTNQASNNQIGIRNVIKFITHPMIFNTLKDQTKKVLIENLLSIIEVIIPSHLFSILISSTEDLVCSLESLLSLLSSDKCSTKLRSLLSLVLNFICNNVESQLKEFPDKEMYQPSAECNFFYTLSQCLALSSLSVPDSMKKIITCCHMILGDKHITPNIDEYLNDATTLCSSLLNLEEKWLIHAISCLCCKQNNSFYEVLLLTNIQEWSKENPKPTEVQLNKLLSLMATVIGAKTDVSKEIILWSSAMHVVQDRVMQKICELAVFLFCDDRQPFHDSIKDLLCSLKHTSHFGKISVWTSVAQLL